MKLAVAINKIQTSKEENLSTIRDLVAEASKNGAKLVLFPETALTGLANTDSPEKDIDLGETIPGKFIKRLSMISKDLNIWIAIGIFERESKTLYDTAILISPEEGIVLKHRRTDPGWHSPSAPVDIYKEGNGFEAVETPFGRATFLICGELFHDDALEAVKRLKPDLLLIPMARSAYKIDDEQQWWDTEEKWFYVERAAKTGANCLFANCLGDGVLEDSFGGAMAIDKNGKIIAELPLFRQGILYVDMNSGG